MKKIIYIIIIGLTGGFFSCSDDELNTNSTGKIPENIIFKDIDAAFVALNGIYRSTYVTGWASGNVHQNFGITSTILYADLTGEDMVQNEMGNGWFYFDYRYQVKSFYTSQAWRPYALWNFYYTLISNVNCILNFVTEKTPGSENDRNNLLGQAYALRAYCYFYLIQIYQRTYIGHENDPGVPLYTEPTTTVTEGNPRGTVQGVYDLINQDINTAIKLLEQVKQHKQKHKSHIDYYVANGIKARIALVQNRWEDAEKAAKAALSKNGLAIASENDILSGFNSINMKGVMWGVEVIEDQATSYASFFSHMDASVNLYANNSRKCVGNWLYNQIQNTDKRKSWWKGQLSKHEDTGTECSYNQLKFRFKTANSYASDYIYMRAEEMVLTAAEALCRQKKYAEARLFLEQLEMARDSGYASRLARITDSDVQTISSEGNITTLLDEILVQRRIELWCEVGRIFDILRLKKGFYRNWNGSNHSDLLEAKDTRNPEWWGPILTIPQSEFDGNINMDNIKDQNPM
ncbi:MAG: RagB/SusD family nutrient uptake outer membrane protein [Dysgonamonadaceae bacterium]|jgi:hypothetical protein|nr:RagB/SusD family nutrient uptake outer membrane protein [Dysgonamonadaceae bacterium]